MDIKNLKESKIVHQTGMLRMKVYHTTEVACHWHDEFEIVMPDACICHCIVDATNFTLHPGEALLIHPGQLHSLRSDYGKMYAVVFHPSVVSGGELGEYLSPEIRFRCLFDEVQDKLLLEDLKQICLAAKSTEYGRELLMKAYITGFIGKLLINGDYVKTTSKTGQNVFVNILNYTNENVCQNELSLDMVAKGCGFSRSYISRLFRENTGKSFCEYVNRCRITKAAQILCMSDDSVLEVALSCGYENVSYFIQRFKRQYGCTPYKYRKKHRK